MQSSRRGRGRRLLPPCPEQPLLQNQFLIYKEQFAVYSDGIGPERRMQICFVDQVLYDSLMLARGSYSQNHWDRFCVCAFFLYKGDAYSQSRPSLHNLSLSLARSLPPPPLCCFAISLPLPRSLPLLLTCGSCFRKVLDRVATFFFE